MTDIALVSLQHLLISVRTPPRKTKRAEGLDEFSLVACDICLCSDWLV